MSLLVKEVIKNSIAEKNKIKPNDIILKINDNDVRDMLEYKFLTADENLKLTIQRNNDIIMVNVSKDFYEDLGMVIEDDSLNSPKTCHNKCVFCFIDQLPQNMRKSLYIKDDDSRFSFLYGNFITLTNMTYEDLNRIIKYRISPVNISVHTTNPELRIKMLNNKNAGDILNKIKILADGGIKMDCQIVLCPGINDGDELVNTINDLYKFFPSITDVAVVPVGVTKFRKNPIKIFNKISANKVIDLVSKLQSKFVNETGIPFVRLADELYLMADAPFPPYDHYEDFAQLEDGVGMIRYFKHCISSSLKHVEFKGNGNNIGIITGTLAESFMKEVCYHIEKKLDININVYAVKNEYFGETITVSGLITGRDIINQLKGKISENAVLIPANMLKADEDIFLDDIKLNNLEKELDLKIVKCKYTGEDFIRKIREVIKCQNQLLQ